MNYDKLFWTKDEGYLDAILEMGDFKSDDITCNMLTEIVLWIREI